MTRMWPASEERRADVLDRQIVSFPIVSNRDQVSHSGHTGSLRYESWLIRRQAFQLLLTFVDRQLAKV